MKAILEKLISLSESLTDINVGIFKSYDTLDKNRTNFDQVTRLFKLDNTFSVDVITDIIYKLQLQDKRYLGAKYSGPEMFIYFSNPDNQSFILEALDNHYVTENIEPLILKLEMLIHEGNNLLEYLKAA